MEVDGTHSDALESASHAQLQATELGKIAALMPYFRPNAPVPESIGELSHDYAPQEHQCGASSHN